MSLTPWFRSPFTDLTGALVSHQFYGRCADIEMQLVDCMEAYGLTRSKQKCALLMEDFKECAFRDKQTKRYIAMRQERKRQYNDGERSKDKLYEPGPAADSM